jgi:Ni/Co efflux regulator RcnB
MKRILLSLAAASAVLTAMPVAASAAPWQPIHDRQANLERRIDQGVHSGELTRREAGRLREQFHDIQRLEARYRRTDDRLTPGERADLDRRYDRLADQVYAQKHDDQVRRY